MSLPEFETGYTLPSEFYGIKQMAHYVLSGVRPEFVEVQPDGNHSLLTRDNLLALQPDFPQTVDDDDLREALELQLEADEKRFSGMRQWLSALLVRYANTTEQLQISRPFHKISQRIAYADTDNNAFFEVESLAYQGSINARGVEYVFSSKALPLLFVTMLPAVKNARDTSTGSTYRMSPQSGDITARHFGQKNNVPLIDPTKSAASNMLTLMERVTELDKTVV